MKKILVNNDLKKLIFSFLRKKPKIKCSDCDKVCVWDEELTTFFTHRESLTYYDILNTCSECFYNYQNSWYISAYT